MEIAVASSAGKRDLVTLDLLGAEASSKDVDSAALKIAPFADLYPLDLNLGTTGGHGDAAGTTVRGCQSVCTIEKVKWALERVAERETLGGREEERRRDGGGGGGDGGGSPSPSSSSSITTASIKRRREGGEEEWADGGDSAGAGGSLVATGCPSCLSYVLISKGDPRCPRCHSLVAPPHPPQHKKPRITLNFSL
ncbi:uncharacterized protein LOC121968160 [Zingiber officinale]|uniref:GIR1-like zinc ribbon domain-containing protein n=1 Tax=Zingiber officinale TaxID=94328 RepID=A0A8J5H876_ZINOF|nr:uncharacterized protein LOC121968160 [Zingiber officinale]KAG6517935.1 hypothetical protein ZIOFF_021335 [Zingiber officinale]